MLHDYIALAAQPTASRISPPGRALRASDADVQFELLLDIYVDGLAKRVEPRGRSR